MNKKQHIDKSYLRNKLIGALEMHIKDFVKDVDNYELTVKEKDILLSGIYFGTLLSAETAKNIFKLVTAEDVFEQMIVKDSIKNVLEKNCAISIIEGMILFLSITNEVVASLIKNNIRNSLARLGYDK